ncbi:MAG: hypothetical protein JWO02_2392 [Solirubrobacterales bacterium]|nr:hypothetical protein [Solirubrobacterales bacterium]
MAIGRPSARMLPETRPAARATLVLAVLLGVASLTLIAASTLLTVAFTDYEVEALPSITAFVHGDVAGFLSLLPAYGGSLILRAPAAWLAHAAGGGELAVYRALAVPCLAAGAAFGVVLWGSLAGRRARAAAWLALGVVVANPLLLPALDTGHPEEYLGAALCAGAVIAALGDRPVVAGLLLGAAGANKAWAVLAVVPALLALRHGRFSLIVTAGVVGGVVLAPALIHGTQAVGSVQAVANQSGDIFQPWQWTWFLGHHGDVVRGLNGGEKPGFRTGPAWLASIGHLPVVALPVALSVLAWVRRVDRQDALLLLALCFLVRCVVDPWDTAYYHLPFLLALAAHEVIGRRRAPVATLAATLAVYGATVIARDHVTPDLQAAVYLLWSVPAVVCCALALYAPARWRTLTAGVLRWTHATLPSLSRLVVATERPVHPQPQPTVVSALGSPLSTSWPSSVTTTRSSIRTPTAPGT